jgi:DeoR/GlpR family transcriptional regulator of sugar metabolism
MLDHRIGPLANAAAEMLFADIMFIGVDGIDPTHGLTCTDAAEAEVLRNLVQHSKVKIVVTDHSKLGSVSKFLLCPIPEIAASLQIQRQMMRLHDLSKNSG